MKALQSLTTLFTKQVTDAGNLEVWAEDGELKCTQGNSVDGFDIAYTVIIAMSSVDVQPHILMMHLVNWLNQYDIDRAEKGLESPSFAVQLLDKGLCDIKLTVDIQESYELEENDNGNWLQAATRFECISAFQKAPTEQTLPPFKYLGGPNQVIHL